jgi:hypothetical protein
MALNLRSLTQDRRQVARQITVLGPPHILVGIKRRNLYSWSFGPYGENLSIALIF